MKIDYLKLSITVYALILLLIGFMIGYIYNLKNYEKHPLAQEIERLNELNKVNFTCSCISLGERTISFTFDNNGINPAYFWNG